MKVLLIRDEEIDVSEHMNRITIPKKQEQAIWSEKLELPNFQCEEYNVYPYVAEGIRYNIAMSEKLASIVYSSQQNLVDEINKLHRENRKLKNAIAELL